MPEELEKRVAALEAEVAELRKIVTEQQNKTGWRKIVGAFQDDPLHEKAMKYGREYRESMRPKEPKKRKKKKRDNT